MTQIFVANVKQKMKKINKNYKKLPKNYVAITQILVAVNGRQKNKKL